MTKMEGKYSWRSAPMPTYKTWARRVALAAHVFAVAGVILGIVATFRSSAGGEPNAIYHRVILGVLIVVLILLATPPARAALGRK